MPTNKEIKLDIVVDDTNSGENIEKVAKDLELLAETAEDSSEELIKLAKDLKEVSSQKIVTDNFVELKKESVQLSTNLEKAKKEAKDLALEIKNTDNPTKKLTASFERQKKRVNQLATEQLKNKKALQDSRVEMLKAGVNAKKYATESRKLDKNLDALTKSAKAATIAIQGESAAAKAATKNTKNLGSSAAKTSQGFSGLKAGIAGAITAGTVALLRKVADGINTAVDSLDNLGKSARRLGLTTDELQNLREVAKASGVEVGAFDTAFQRFARRAGQARLGTGELVKAFEYLNIQLEDSNGNTKTNTELFAEYGQKVSQVKDENVQLALTMAGVDTEGVKLIEMFRLSAEEQQNIINKSNELAGALDKGLIVKAEQAATQIGQLTTAQERLDTEMSGSVSSWLIYWESFILKIKQASHAAISFFGIITKSRKQSNAELIKTNALLDGQIKRAEELLKIETDPARIKALNAKLNYAKSQKKAIEELIQAEVDLLEKKLEPLGEKVSEGVEIEINKSAELAKARHEEAKATEEATKTNRAYKKELSSEANDISEAATIKNAEDNRDSMFKALSNKPVEHNVKSVQEHIGSPISLTPEQATQKAKEIKQAMQKEFDTNPVQVRVKTPSLPGSIQNYNAGTSPGSGMFDGSWGSDLSKQSLKSGTKQ